MEIIWQQTSTAKSQRINLGSPKFKNYSVVQLLKPRALIQYPNKRIYMFSMLLYARGVVLRYSAERAHTAGDVKQEDGRFHFSSACRVNDCYSTHAHLHGPSLPKDVDPETGHSLFSPHQLTARLLRFVLHEPLVVSIYSEFQVETHSHGGDYMYLKEISIDCI